MEGQFRKINFGFINNNNNFKSNYINTTKYNAFNFLPKCLLIQFKRYANIYFLVAAIIQSIPIISPLNPISAVAPLIFVIGISIVREAFEDFNRYKSDLEINSYYSNSYIYKSKWKNIIWKDIKVGDIIKIKKNEFFPADLVLISSYLENGNCFIQTSSLDGEKNLKPRQSINDIHNLYYKNNIDLLGNIKVNKPNQDLYHWEGHIEIWNKNYPISNKNLLLRGSVLKNTEYIIGIVVYTGFDTKVMKNSEKSKFKQSKIEDTTNKLIVIIFVFQLLLCLVVFINSVIWNYRYYNNYEEYIVYKYNKYIESLFVFFSIFILLTTMIPISLIISLEMVKLVQAYFINKDLDMIDFQNNRNSKVFNSSLNEELGQIEYIFTDKTGTLTCNRMKFKNCIIGNKLYEISDKCTLILLDKNIDSDNISNLIEINNNFIINNYEELYDMFFKLLSLCHDCILDIEEKEKGNLKYEGESPDEIVLVDTAKNLDYKFLENDSYYKVVNINNKIQNFIVLNYFEFTSDRKRASIIVIIDNNIFLLIKGADSIIIDRLSKSKKQPFLDKINKELLKFSKIGFRTLCMAIRHLTIEEYELFNSKYKGFLINNKKEEVNKLISDLENDLLLIGCTAVEDKLQDQVPESINSFINSGIKVWMLTGDKLETAENIGYSCKLIEDNFKKYYLYKEKSIEEIKNSIVEIKSSLKNNLNNLKKVLLIDGKIISLIINEEEILKDCIMNLFNNFNSIVCCRMSPKQKALIVRYVRRYLKKITLAVGDGANDVNMIQEADIGIGLYGEEGLRAVQSSDYALANFKCLWRLLFIHGRWSYFRITELIKFFFYKNLWITIPQFVYNFYNNFSSQTIFEDFYITLFNMAFTSFPILVKAIFEQDIYYKKWTKKFKKKYLEKNTLTERQGLKKYIPYLYYLGQNNLGFNKKLIFYWILNGIFTILIIYYILLYMYENVVMNATGHIIDLWSFSITLYFNIILVINIEIMFLSKYITVLSFISVFLLSIFLYVLYSIYSDSFEFFLIYKKLYFTYTNFYFYFISIFIQCLFVLKHIFILIIDREFNFNLSILFRSIVKNKSKNDITKLSELDTIIKKT